MKKLSTFLIILIFSQLGFAQITYESSDFADVGENFPVVNLLEIPSYNYSQTGANHFWDFNSLNYEPVTNFGYENPNNSPFKTTWCLFNFYIFNCDEEFDNSFNLGLNLNQTIEIGEYSLNNPYQHLLKNNAELQSKMLGANIDFEGSTIPAILEYSNPDVLLKFPMNYNDTYTDDNLIEMDFSDFGYNLQISSTGNRLNHVEGWGDLKIRNFVFENVLKVKSTNTQFFNIYYEGEHTATEAVLVSYMWFHKDFGIPVLTVSGTELEGEFIPSSVSYVEVDSMGIENYSKLKSIVYPNPTSGEFHIQLGSNEVISNVQIFDQSGKLVGNKLNISSLEKGVYTVVIQTNKQKITEKIIRK